MKVRLLLVLVLCGTFLTACAETPAEVPSDTTAKTTDAQLITTETEDPLSEVNARRCVTDYFNDRADYLRSELDDFVTAVPAIVRDEEAHREKLQTDDIMFVESEITIDAVYCYDTHTEVYIAEAVTYVQSGETRQEVIDHEVSILVDENGDPIVASDRYREEYSDFNSCSYVPPEAE